MVLPGRFFHRFLVAAAVVGSGALVAGCGGSAPARSSQGKTPSIVRAAYVSGGTAGYKTDMNMTETVDGTNIAMTGSGWYRSAGHDLSLTMNVQLPASSPLSNVQMTLVLENGTIYVKLPAALASKIPGGKQWLSADLAQLGKIAGNSSLGSLLSGDSLSQFTNPGQYLNFLRATASGSVNDVGQENVDGTATTHYQADVDFSKLASAVPADERQYAQQLVTEMQKHNVNAQLPVDVWIDHSNLIRRLKLTMNLSASGHTVAIVVTQDFSDYGTQPVPAVPSSDETTDIVSLLKNIGG